MEGQVLSFTLADYRRHSKTPTLVKKETSLILKMLQVIHIPQEQSLLQGSACKKAKCTNHEYQQRHEQVVREMNDMRSGHSTLEMPLTTLTSWAGKRFSNPLIGAENWPAETKPRETSKAGKMLQERQLRLGAPPLYSSMLPKIPSSSSALENRCFW